jgi:biotin carboxylase
MTGGYSQIEATCDAYLEPADFLALPDKFPSPFKAHGQEVILVSYSKGIVEGTPGFDVVRSLPSFLVLESSVSKGSEVDYTIDLVTCTGSIILMHSDPATLQKDVDFVRHMEKINGFFNYETKLESLKRPRSDNAYGHRRGASADGPNLIRHFSNDRPELRGGMGGGMGMRRAMTTTDASKEIVVLIDPYSTGCCIAQEIKKRGYSILALWTCGFAPEMKLHVPLSCEGLKYMGEIEEDPAGLDATLARIQTAAGKLRIVAVIAGGEAGVDVADALSEKMKLRSNGTEISNRRDKKVQQELIKAAGYRAVRQAGGADFGDVDTFLQTEAYPVVLKPTESAGSDGVKLCHNYEEAKDHFHMLMKSQMINGGDCGAVLCQEFLRGKEYVVDHVSRDGIHKTVMVFVYDKRPVNGSQFVYFGCVPVDPNSAEARILIPYIRGVLDALGCLNGPSHGEVMMTPDGPCLVEMNCRAHGGDGNWRPLCRALTGGYSQVEATVDAYLEKKSFFDLPDKPPSPFKAAGQEVILVSFSRGTVKATPGLEIIQQLASFVYLETGVKPGTKVDYTVDLFTCIGSVILMHEDKELLEADVNKIRQLEKDNELFEYEQEMTLLKSFSKINLSDMGNEKEHKQVHSISSDRADMY